MRCFWRLGQEVNARDRWMGAALVLVAVFVSPSAYAETRCPEARVFCAGRCLAPSACPKKIGTFRVHTDEVRAVDFSADGTRFLSASADGTIRVWDAANGRTLKTLKHGPIDVYFASFGAGDGVILSGGRDAHVKLWDVRAGKARFTWPLGAMAGRHSTASVSADGRWAATGNKTEIILWELEGGREVRRWSARKGSFLNASVGIALAFHPAKAEITSGSGDATIRVWDPAAGRLLRKFKAHKASIVTLAYSGDGRILVTGSHDRTAKVWDAETLELKHVLSGHTSGVCSVACSADGTRIITGSYDGTARIWSVATGKELAVLKGHKGFVLGVAIAPFGEVVLTGSADKTVRTWSIKGL